MTPVLRITMELNSNKGMDLAMKTMTTPELRIAMEAMAVTMKVTMWRRVEKAVIDVKVDGKKNVQHAELLHQLHGSSTLALVLGKETSTTKIW
jgi:hypothetical protein